MFNIYPYTDFHEMNLDWFLMQFKELVDDWETFKNDLTAQWEQVSQDWQTLYNYVHDYFDNLDVQAEIDNKLNEMAADGSLLAVIRPTVITAAGDWLEENLTPTSPPVDSTLTISGAAADAKVTGGRLTDLKEDLSFLNDAVTVSFPVDMWETGSISSLSGNNTSSNPLLRTKNYVPSKYVKFSALTGYELRIYKYGLDNSFIGILKSDGSFSTDTTNEKDVTEYVPDYTSGKYKLVLFKASNHSSEVTPEEYINVLFAHNRIDDAEEDVANIEYELQLVENQIGDPKYNPIGSDITPDTTQIGKYVIGEIGNNLSESSGSAYCYAKYNVSEGTYWVRTRVGTNSAIHHYIYVVGTGNIIIARYAEPLESADYKEYVPIVVPSDGSYLYVISNASGRFLGEVKLAEVISVQSQIDDINAEKICYVDASADSGGDGSREAPYNSISEPANLGYDTFIVKAGEYAPFSIQNRTNVHIGLWTMPDYDSTVHELPKIVIKSTGSTGIVIQNCQNVYLSDIHVEDVIGHSFLLQNINKLECVRCYASGNIVAGASEETYCGFKIKNVNGIFTECMAWDIDLDGFNIHGYGSTTFLNCIAHDCQDDGLSHHDGCTGAVIGGEYYNCDKGGISTPTHGAIVDVNGAYCHDNIRHGIHATGATSSGKISNCVCKNNGQYDIYVDEATIIAWNNLYDTKSIGDTAAFTEFS